MASLYTVMEQLKSLIIEEHVVYTLPQVNGIYIFSNSPSDGSSSLHSGCIMYVYIRVQAQGMCLVPCGTLLGTLDELEQARFALTVWFLLERNSWIHIPSFPAIPRLGSLWH